MGWFSNSPSDPSGEDDNGDGQSTDTFGHLRPEVREFLEREAPIKPSARQVPVPGSTSTRELETEGELAGQEKREFDPTVYSKYGKKYADIWAQYRPPAIIEAEYRTPSTAINDVYQSYRDRKSAIGAAAMENCVFQQLALQDCYSSGGKLAKLTACTAENNALQDCFKSQQAFLKALGYMNDAARDPAVDERIQMHADKLYREQSRKEEEIQANAEAGRPLGTPSSEGGDGPLSAR